MTSLASYASHGVLFATHSIGLARSVAEEIYVTKAGPAGSTIKPFGAEESLSELLGELSYSAMRELGYTKILGVEGVKDIKTIQQLLRKIEKDREVVLLPLGGSAMINGQAEGPLREIQRISADIRILIDSEKHLGSGPLAKDRQAFVRVCESIGIQLHVLERRAIENYLVSIRKPLF
jgi:hypothetical protein